jgi:hypothetical protein
MDLLKTEDVAGTTVFDLRLSEDELEILANALGHLVGSLDEEQLIDVFVAIEDRSWADTSDITEFARETYYELMDMLRDNCRPSLLPQRFRDWNRPALNASPKPSLDS